MRGPYTKEFCEQWPGDLPLTVLPLSSGRRFARADERTETILSIARSHAAAAATRQTVFSSYVFLKSPQVLKCWALARSFAGRVAIDVLCGSAVIIAKDEKCNVLDFGCRCGDGHVLVRATPSLKMYALCSNKARLQMAQAQGDRDVGQWFADRARNWMCYCMVPFAVDGEESESIFESKVRQALTH